MRLKQSDISHPVPEYMIELIGIQLNGGKYHGYIQNLADRLHVDRRTIHNWLTDGTPNENTTARIRALLPAT